MRDYVNKTLQNRHIPDAAYASLTLFFIAVYTYAHIRAAYTFPMPWIDEATFLWQAIAFKDTNSLYAPQLNEYREIMWMPPGYMAATGLIFKATGFSFGLARWLSFAYMLAAFILLLLMTRKYPLRLASLAFCGLFFTNRLFIVTGNIARMESMLLMLVLAGFLLLQNRRYYAGLALLSLTPVVHPNGLFFLAGGAAYVFFCARYEFRGRRPSRLELLLILFAAASWAAYLSHTAGHWPDFVRDMTFQMGRKAERNVPSVLMSAETIIPLSAALLGLVAGLRRNVGSVLLLFIGVPALLVMNTGLEMWYEVFKGVFLLTLSLFLLQLGHHFLQTIPRLNGRRMRIAGLTLIALALLCGDYYFGMVELSSRYPWNIEWCGMRFNKRVPYAREGDFTELTSFLDSLQRSRPNTTIEFQPYADSLFFYDRFQGIRFHLPTFCGTRADAYVIHMSRHIPLTLERKWQEELLEYANRTSPGEIEVIYRRNDTEIWYYVPRQKGSEDTSIYPVPLKTEVKPQN